MEKKFTHTASINYPRGQIYKNMVHEILKVLYKLIFFVRL
ncbi:hypothetical protein NC99_37270 [Sunxiuqinia dokdonensis]|uniref:Uncharacterized protein n=1 Tax=Sunxiuqinia dokdonensis TaxID=1409788 RepID=A0A0L8V509_9BACT|nr:hypothetical protein NC99_37270 [Sunxiuqinia dokdonensis]